jgi:hypothetical protein
MWDDCTTLPWIVKNGTSKVNKIGCEVLMEKGFGAHGHQCSPSLLDKFLLII